MSKQIKVSLLDDEGKEIDYITRNIPSFNIYNFPKGILIDLGLILERNNILFDWLSEQFGKISLIS